MSVVSLLRTRRRQLARPVAVISQGRLYGGSGGLVALLLSAALIGVLGVTLHPRLLLLMPALGVLLATGLAWPWLTMLFVRGELHFACDRIHADEEVHASLRLGHRAAWPVWGLVLEVDADNRQALDAVRAFSSVSVSFAVRPQRRGRYPGRPAFLQSGFPFGLVNVSRSVTLRHPLVVWPRVLAAAGPPDWSSADMAVGHVETRRVGSTGDTVGVREYRRGDPMRWIHWPQTARHDRFMVREFQASGVPRVRIVLDCDAEMHVGQGADSSFEWAVRIAASLASRWLEDGAEVEILAGSVRLPPAAGQVHRRRVLDALAGVALQRVGRRALMPRSELATVLVSTDLGWERRPEPPCCSVRGFMLRSEGFGGVRRAAASFGNKVVVIESPGDVPVALLRVKRGLADVA